jgi:hypothetical protein
MREREREDGTNTEGEIVAMRNVREFPPMESWSSLVSRDSLLGGEVVRRGGGREGGGPVGDMGIFSIGSCSFGESGDALPQCVETVEGMRLRAGSTRE